MTAAVEVRNATKSFGSHQIFDGLDFTAERGKVTVIIGPSGSGKSTLLRVINHLERLDAGCVRVDGELIGVRVHRNRLKQLSERVILKQRARIGFVFQHFNLFPNLTVLDNIVEAPVAALGIDRARGAGPCARAAGQGRTGGQGRPVSPAALRRATAAGRDRPRARP